MKKDVHKLLSSVEKKLIKRIHEKPSKEALDKLAVFVGFQSWADFRAEMKEEDAKDEPTKK